jgi:hypothetical protein
VVTGGIDALPGVPMAMGVAGTAAHAMVGRSAGVAGVTEPGVVIVGTPALTGEPKCIRVAITGAKTTLWRSLCVFRVEEPGVAIATACAVLGVLVTRDGNQ